MLPNIKIGCSGHFKNLEVLDSKGNVKRSIRGPNNLITDIGLNRLNAPNDGDVYSFCRVGTGNSIPLPTNTNLDNQVASAGVALATYSQGVNIAEGYMWCRIVWTFELGAVVANVSELATGWSASGNTIFSRALVLDPEGNPTSITVLEDEQLRVTWEHRRYWQVSPSTGTIANEGNKGGSYNWEIRPARVSQWEMSVGSQESRQIRGGQVGTFGSTINLQNTPVGSAPPTRILTAGAELSAVTGSPVGGLANSSSESNIISTIHNPGASVTARITMGVSVFNNPNGMAVFHIFLGGSGTTTRGPSRMEYQMLIDPPIMKTSEDYLELDVTVEWGRYESA